MNQITHYTSVAPSCPTYAARFSIPSQHITCTTYFDVSTMRMQLISTKIIISTWQYIIRFLFEEMKCKTSYIRRIYLSEIRKISYIIYFVYFTRMFCHPIPCIHYYACGITAALEISSIIKLVEFKKWM